MENKIGIGEEEKMGRMGKEEKLKKWIRMEKGKMFKKGIEEKCIRESKRNVEREMLGKVEKKKKRGKGKRRRVLKKKKKREFGGEDKEKNEIDNSGIEREIMEEKWNILKRNKKENWIDYGVKEEIGIGKIIKKKSIGEC